MKLYKRKKLRSSLKMQKNCHKINIQPTEGFSSKLNSAEICDLQIEHPHFTWPWYKSLHLSLRNETAYENLESHVGVGYEESSYSFSYLLVNWPKVTRCMCINSSRSHQDTWNSFPKQNNKYVIFSRPKYITTKNEKWLTPK